MEKLHPEDGKDGLRGSILLSGIYGSEAADGSDHVYFGEAAQVEGRVPLAHLEGRAVPLFVIDAEFDPLIMQRSAISLIDAVCRRDRKCPHHKQIPGHNHYSMTYHINTLDDSIAGDILEFITSLSADD